MEGAMALVVLVVFLAATCVSTWLSVKISEKL